MTTQSLRERRAERERKNRELVARILASRERQIASSVSNQPQQVIQPSTTPFIPQTQQAQVQADLSAQRTAFTPLGDIGVGTEAAAPDTRGKPEFGSWWGSGVAENLAGGALPALENLQKGLETFGGLATSTVGAFTPGDLMGIESKLAEEREERGVKSRLPDILQATPLRAFDVLLSGNPVGELQAQAEAFRETKMPSTQISLPGEGIPLPGGRKIDDIDVGVKGAIELLPEIALGIATGGFSTGASLSRRAGTSILNAFGADILTGAAKLGSKGGRKITEAVIQAPDVVGRVPDFTDISKLSARIDRVKSQGTIDAINKLPERIRGLEIRRYATSAMSALSPARIADTTRAAVKARLLNSMALDEISKMNELAMAEFVKRLSFAGVKMPDEVADFSRGHVEGVPFSTSFTVEKGVDGGADVIIEGLIGNTGIDAIDDGVLMGKPVLNPLTGKKEQKRFKWSYNEVLENFFKTGDVNVPRFLDKAGKPVKGAKTLPKGGMTNPKWEEQVFSRTEVAKEFGGANIGSWSVVAQKYVPDIRTKGGIEAFDPVAANFATYVRHWQDTNDAIAFNYIAASGKPIKGTAVLDKVSSRYSPRNNNGDYLLEDADIANNTTRLAFSGGTPGRKNKALNPRELRNAEIRELMNEGEYSLSNPMVALKQHDLAMRRAAWDAQLTKHLKAAAKDVGSGVIEIAPRKGRTTAAINRIASGTTDKLDDKTIADIREQFPNTANILVKAMKHGKGTKVRQDKLKTIQEIFADEVTELEKGKYLVTKPGAVLARAGGKKGGKKAVISRENRMPAYTGLYFEDKAEVNRLIKQHYPNTKLTDESSLMATTNSFSKILAETGDIIRLGRTGFDFGYWLIQGLPSLGFAAAKTVSPGKATEAGAAVEISNTKLGRDLVKIWVKSVPEAFKAFRSQDRMMLSLVDDVNIVNEAIGNGLQIGMTSTDAFQAVQNGTILRKLGDPVDGFGTKADKLLTKAADPFQRAFIAPGDYIRVQMYKAMRPVAKERGDDGLRELSSVLNNMTGAFSSSAAGVHPTMQNIERGILAFSARYTRSSLALLTAVFRGGIEGRTARESMAGMLGLGVAAYITAVEAINLAGGKQDVHLDPTKSQFMTFDIGGDKLGFGSFWTQFAKVTSKTTAIAWDEDAREAFLGDETIRTNPLIRWVRSRSAPGFAGTAWDIAVGEDFLGRDIDGPKDWTKHVGRQTLPIWFEAMVLGDPKRTGLLGGLAEVGGARVRPLSSKERRRDLRNRIAQDVYDKDWVDLNGLERDRINAGEVEMSLSEQEELNTLNEEVLAANVERGDEDDLVIEKYHKRHTDIEDEWNENIAEGIELLTAHPEIMDLEKFRHMYLSSANSIRRSKLEELNDKEGEFALAIEYFQKTSERFGEDNPEDIAYNEYITSILATDDFDIPGGFDYDARDIAIQSFQATWGNEVFAYVQERFATGRNIPVLVNEFWQGRKRFEHYWGDVDEATLATMPNSTALEPAYKEWTRASENRRSELEEITPYLKAMIDKISRVRRAMREQDPLLDAWLFRWGFTQNFVHPDNKFSPDGADDPAKFWREPEPKPLRLFGIQDGVII
jgi:hypothetical protein